MRKLVLPLVVNLVLGILAIVPLFLVWYVLSNGPLATAGWTTPEPTENDGMLIWAVIAALAVGMVGSIWGLVNVWIRRKVSVPASRYWPACAVATLVPFSILLLR